MCIWRALWVVMASRAVQKWIRGNRGFVNVWSPARVFLSLLGAPAPFGPGAELQTALHGSWYGETQVGAAPRRAIDDVSSVKQCSLDWTYVVSHSNTTQLPRSIVEHRATRIMTELWTHVQLWQARCSFDRRKLGVTVTLTASLSLSLWTARARSLKISRSFSNTVCLSGFGSVLHSRCYGRCTGVTFQAAVISDDQWQR